MLKCPICGEKHEISSFDGCGYDFYDFHKSDCCFNVTFSERPTIKAAEMEWDKNVLDYKAKCILVRSMITDGMEIGLSQHKLNTLYKVLGGVDI